MDDSWIELVTGGDLLVRSAARWPDNDALVYPDQRVTYSRLLVGARHAARALLGLEVRPGERVGILMPNCLDFMETYLGCHLIGAVPVTINARYKPRELAHVAADAELVAVLTTDLIAEYAPFVDLLAAAFEHGRPASLRSLVMLGESDPAGYLDRAGWDALAATVPDTDVESMRRSVRLRDLAVIMYTSGTTSHPRGCPMTHEALVRTALAVGKRFRLTAGERFWNPLPLFHMGGLLPTTANLLNGGTVISAVHFDADTALKMLVAEQVTFAYPTFPTITQSLIHHPDFRSADLSRIRGLLDTAPPEVLRQVQEAFPAAKVIASYGLTEAGGVICYSELDDDLDRRTGTSGRPFEGMRVRIVDPETEIDCAPGQVGEIRVTGPGMFEGYLNDPVTTAERTDPLGYFRTGDLGCVDVDGRITYTGRLKDMLKVGGENVAAAEIEAHLARHPAVKIAQVVSAPDVRLVEVAAAFVELVPGAAVTAEELIAHCTGSMASFKVPRHIRFVQEWPMSTTKIQKVRLREAIARELESSAPHPG
ncbi:class I adenylate-forming enzyme family protein [Nocardia grenadensis]|uniref:class I adenylate-forming enzyme family protein n=1 Tax=Nocardia grenadensis TaxID=931537 RepID=UPI003D7432CD